MELQLISGNSDCSNVATTCVPGYIQAVICFHCDDTRPVHNYVVSPPGGPTGKLD